MTDRRPADGVT